MSEFVCEACGRKEFEEHCGKAVCSFCESEYKEEGEGFSPEKVFPKEYVELLEKAEEYRESERKVRETIALFDAIEMCGGTAKIWSRLSELYRSSKLFEKALECAENAIKSDAEYPKGYVESGISLAVKLRYDEAIERYQKALSLMNEEHPEYVPALVNYAIAAAKTGDKQTAAELIMTAEAEGFDNAPAVRKSLGISLFG